ncbi:MAG: hypothetical protein KDK12_03250 [Rhodobacteraceae bacterium]|nr:hypothetical protein [Paracoccaceae bacterium]
MRVLLRIAAWLVGLLVLLAAVLAAPVLWVETMCRGTAQPVTHVALSHETRPAIRTLLTYPEWHIVHAYDEYAEVIRTQDPHNYDFLRAIAGFWTSACTLTRESAALGVIDTETKTTIYVIGASFTLEMALKAAYEETLGRIATWVRGPEHAPLDLLSAQQAAGYARFLRQVPWYRYDFRADAAALDAADTGVFRDRERSVALGVEHRTRALYADAIASAVAATGQDDLTLQMVVEGLPPDVLAAVPGVTVLGPVGNGWEVETPRYAELTAILADWAGQGARLVDMAGNDRILFTAVSDRAQEAGALLDLPRQGYGDARHLFLVPVTDLAQILRDLPARGLTLEHVHDY